MRMVMKLGYISTVLAFAVASITISLIQYNIQNNIMRGRMEIAPRDGGC